MARTQASPASITVTKKRKSTGDIDEGRSKQAKQPRKTLDTFFAPQVPASPTPDEETGRIEHVALNEEQIKVLKMVVQEEKNVFFTGSAGTGKSLLLRAIISALRKKHAKKPKVISVTASTGMAASNVGGVTIHSWGAVTPGMHDVEKLISFVKTCKPAHKRWKDTKVLIIDEVSMVDGKLFDTLAALAERLRKPTQRPFGGIQLVVTGDFFQLPPVTSGGRTPFFAFQSKAWNTCIEHIVTLKQVFRQKDIQFVDLLNEMRRGQISAEGKTIFRSLSRPLTFADGLLPTELFPLRAEVEKANVARLASLSGTASVFEARDTGSAPADKRAKLLDNMVALKDLQLKINAQVMLIKNVDETLVNGSVGKVLGFFPFSAAVASSVHGASAQVVKKEVTTRRSASPSKPESSSQDPITTTLKLGSMVRNVSVGQDGRTPVSLLDKENVEPNKEDKKPPSSKGKIAKEEELYPLVEFFTHQGKEIVLVVREEFRVEDNEGKPLARRVQIPLVLAWAMSIHKSQGQTIQRVRIDLGKVFEKGQSYVALSRAASLDSLQVVRFDPTKVQAHAEVVKWSKKVEEEQAALAALQQQSGTKSNT